MSLDIIKQHKILAKKSLGQNFLIDEDILESIVGSIDIAGKNIIEVGPGYGALTEQLLFARPQRLSLVELDRDMVKVLEHRLEKKELDISGVDFSLYNQDILTFEPDDEIYSVIANIPYYITSPILRHFLYNVSNSPESMMILMQKDVGDKILGGKKNKTSVIRLLVEKKCSVQEKIFVPKESFYPTPKIESSVLLFETHDEFLDTDDALFLEIIKIGFSANRKKLIKNLIGGGFKKEIILDFFQKYNISEMIRGEDLSIEVWIKLVSYLGSSQNI